MPQRIQLTRGLFALVDDEDYWFLSRFKWHAQQAKTTHYAVHTVNAPRVLNKPRRHVAFAMHRIITMAPPWLDVDHLNFDGLDNRRENLRLAAHGDNSMRRRPWGKSGYRGVMKYTTKLWIARIGLSGGKLVLGTFNTPQEAALAYDEAAVNLYGEYAYLNFQHNHGQSEGANDEEF